METKNAIIESATITSDDHGCLSAWLHLDYGGSGQGFGGSRSTFPRASRTTRLRAWRVISSGA